MRLHLAGHVGMADVGISFQTALHYSWVSAGGKSCGVSMPKCTSNLMGLHPDDDVSPMFWEA